MSKKFKLGNFAGKGYYIALILCAVAIGITGYLYYQNVKPDPSLQDPLPTVDVMDPQDPTVDVIGPQPDPTGPTPGNPPVKKPMKTGMPVSGQTVAEYAMDCLSYNETTRDWRTHDGVDIAAEAGTQVLAAADGTVYTVYEDDTMGTTVVIRHEDGYVTRYASLDQELCVAPGDVVILGQVIGCVGETALVECALGPHVHFSVSKDGEVMDPASFWALNKG